MRTARLIVIVVASLVATRGNAQTKYWIEFRDKGVSPSSFHSGNAMFESVRRGLSATCLSRRARAMQCDPARTITLEDAPVAARYQSRLRKLGVEVLSVSRWCNAVSALLSPRQLTRVASLPFVRSVHTVGHATELGVTPTAFGEAASSPSSGNAVPLSVDSFCGYNPIIYHYGLALSQLSRINVWPLHAMGFDGSGIRFGILDCGFRWRENPSLRHSNVINEYDYIFHDSVTENEAIDTIGQDGHGTCTLSASTGYLPDTLVGPAYNVSIMLAKTEDIRSEHHIEEDNYAAALEDMEALGVDITSSSLGYFIFDAPDQSYTYGDMNGHTTICTRAAARAAKLGVLVVTAMGNSGQDPQHPHEQAPGDADSILSVGALDTNEYIANFSSLGPTADGRTKPEICAPGVHVWLQDRNGGFGPGNGTSFATPLTAGASCLIMQAHPMATAQQIRQAIMKTGSYANRPDTVYGWGRLNAYAAALELGPIAHVMNGWADSTAAHICAGAASKNKIKYIYVLYKGDVDITQKTVIAKLVADSLIYSVSVPVTSNNSKFYYRVKAVDALNGQAFDPATGWDSIALPFSPPPPMGVSTQSALNFTVTAYPNPAIAELNVTASEAGEWALLDVLGKRVLAGSATEKSVSSIDVSSVEAGQYFLRYVARTGQVKSVMVVVSH